MSNQRNIRYSNHSLSSRFVLAFSLFLIMLSSVSESFNNTIRVCMDDSMLTRCTFSVFYKKDYLNNKIIFQIDRLILKCPSDALVTNQTLAELKTFEKRCQKIKKFSPKTSHRFNSLLLIEASRSRMTIINESMGLFFRDNGLRELWNSFAGFNGFKGVDIASTIEFNMSASFEYQGTFDLYVKGRLVKNCDDYVKSNASTRGFIFTINQKYSYVSGFDLTFIRPSSRVPVCSLFFRHSRINSITFERMIHSFYFKSMITFTDHEDGEKKDYDFSVDSLNLRRIYGVDVDSRLLNPNIFAKIHNLELRGHMNSIATDVFVSFRNLRNLQLYVTNIMKLIHRQGIEWIKRINSRVRVNLSNATDTKLNERKSFGFYSTEIETFGLKKILISF